MSDPTITAPVTRTAFSRPATLTATERPCPTRISDVADLATIPLWSPTEPNAAGLLGVSRSTVNRMSRRGELPVLRARSRVLVKVPSLLAMLDAAT